MVALLAAVAVTWAFECSCAAAKGTEDSRPVKKDAPTAKDSDNKPAAIRDNGGQSPAVVAQPQSRDQKAQRDTEQTRRDQEWKESKGQQKDFWDYANAASTVAIAVFTLFLVIFGAVQAYATKKSVEAMRHSTDVALEALSHARETTRSTLEEARRTSGLTLRAYVGVQETTIRADEREGGFWAHAIVKNAGLTPALTVDCLGGIAVGPFPETGDPLPPTKSGPRAVLLPGGTLSQEVGIWIMPPDMIAIREGVLTLFAYGEIQYVDFFGHKRITTWRMIADPNDVRPGVKDKPMRVCRDGNSMT